MDIASHSEFCDSFVCIIGSFGDNIRIDRTAKEAAKPHFESKKTQSQGHFVAVLSRYSGRAWRVHR